MPKSYTETSSYRIDLKNLPTDRSINGLALSIARPCPRTPRALKREGRGSIINSKQFYPSHNHFCLQCNQTTNTNARVLENVIPVVHNNVSDLGKVINEAKVVLPNSSSK